MSHGESRNEIIPKPFLPDSSVGVGCLGRSQLSAVHHGTTQLGLSAGGVGMPSSPTF